MADVHTAEVRSYNMSRIRSKDTRPELIVRKFLFANGFRYRLHRKDLPGKPDIVLPRYKTVIFVHGCFWHGHEGCRYYVMPKTRTEWWKNKIERNRQLVRIHTEKLEADNWHVISLFECSLKKGRTEQTLNKLLTQIKSKDGF